MLEKLKTIRKATILSSNPCFELWYLLHFQEQKTEITSSDCIEKLTQYIQKYSKGLLTDDSQNRLEQGQAIAVKRALELEKFKNPSSQLFVFINEIESVL